MSVQPGTYIDHDNWHKTPVGREYFASILRHGKRRTFGCMESPMPATHLAGPQIIKYKLCLVGKTAVGKSSTVAKLSGQSVPMTHSETPGIVTTTAYWPAFLKSSGKPIMFRLQFWDAGESVKRKFDHIQPACREGAHATIYLFSFVDRSSFEDLGNQLKKASSSGNEDTPLRVVIGTKYDQYNRSEITSRELHDFQEQWKVPVLRLKNVVKPTESNALLSGDSNAEIDDIAPVMNTLVEYLWVHEQVLAGNIRYGSVSQSRHPLPGVSRDSAIGSEGANDSEDDEATYV
ncbi:ciliogenesis and planar polarity effector 2-like [Diadema antillarum]|uniref:ciliogenesis and planar polarity effector 2-like n=1 Tax=Diadema antillarum TaxID=105358 RepID=UPI003A8952A4